MPVVEYSKNSPYYTTPQASWYRSNMNFRDIPSNGTDYIMILESKYQYRPDKLAYDLYGTVDLWWVFSIRNPNIIKNPIWDMKTGIEIFITTPSTLFNILGS